MQYYLYQLVSAKSFYPPDPAQCALLEYQLELSYKIGVVCHALLVGETPRVYIVGWLKSFSLIATYQIITPPCQTL